MVQSEKKERRTLLIVSVLAAYILLQVCWWGYSLLNISALYSMSSAPGDATMNNDIMAGSIRMVIGEGSVFLILLLLGFWYIRRSITRQLQLARMEKTFLLSVTHELKTPIAAIRLFLETIKTRRLSEEQMVSIVSDALRETQRLQNMSENILLATGFDNRHNQPLSETVRIGELLEQVVQRAHTPGGADFVTQVDHNATVIGDRELLRAMCVNLVENAVKYGGAGGSIRVTLTSGNGVTKMEIADNGPGIPMDEKERVFEKFYRSGDEGTRRQKGTGLGLYIVHNVVRLHGGSIRINDNTPHGTIFVVTLPD